MDYIYHLNEIFTSTLSIHNVENAHLYTNKINSKINLNIDISRFVTIVNFVQINKCFIFA